MKRKKGVFYLEMMMMMMVMKKEFRTVFTGYLNPERGKHLHNTMWTDFKLDHTIIDTCWCFLCCHLRLYATYLVNPQRDSQCPLLSLAMLYDCDLVSVNLLLFYIKKHSCQPISWVQGTLMVVNTTCKFIQSFFLLMKRAICFSPKDSGIRFKLGWIAVSDWLIVILEQDDETTHRMCSSALLKKYSMRNC